MNRQERWNLTVSAMKADIDGFDIRFKPDSKFQKFLGFISVWSWKRDEEGNRVYGYMDMTTTLGTKVWFKDEEYVNTRLPSETLEHEWIHLKDQKTFFGILPFLPSWVNSALFGICYIIVLPWPGLGRAYAELRAYRRSLEVSEDDRREAVLEFCVGQFTGPNYFFMWPFPEQVKRLLQEPSPYKEEMDKATGRSSG